jgi:AcrR family transcriptional regulator
MPRRGLDAETIVREAAALADDRGTDAVTLKALAAALGVKPPSLYAHVKGLEDIRTRMADMAYRDLEATLAPAAAGLARGEAVRAIGMAYRGWVKQHPGIYAIVEPGPAVDLPSASQVLNPILAVLRGYGLGHDDSIHAARALRSAIHGFTTIEMAGGFGIDLEIDASFEWMLAALDQGISAAAPGPASG